MDISFQSLLFFIIIIMKKVIFTNVAWIGNAGDYYSAPGMYYKFPNINIHHIHFLDFYGAMTKNPDFEEYNVKNKIIVIGGGGLITDEGYYLQDTVNWLVENNKVIFWGVGSNAFQKPYYEIFNNKNVLLVGTRDISPSFNYDYVPCVSCKSHLFDSDYQINSEIGIIEHPLHPVNIEGLPKISNSENIDTIIEFLGSKEVIISSTFHGIYWSQLLGKKVLYYTEDEKINLKYYNMKNRVEFCNSIDYSEKINIISSLKNFKEESRKFNDDFYKKVSNLL